MPTDNTGVADPRKPDRRLFVGIILAAALSPLGSTMIAVALPGIGQELAVPDVTLTHWLAVSYLVVSLAGQGPGGALGDRIGHALTLAIGVSLYGIGATLGLLASALPWLAVARVLMASGGALTVPSAMALLRNRTTIERRSRAFGVFAASMGIAAALGPLVGGWLIPLFGWRAVFAVNIPIILASLLLVRRELKTRNSGSAAARFDWIGTLLLVIGLGLTTTAVTIDMKGAGWLGAIGVVLLVGFVAWNLASSSPVVDLRLFARRQFAAGCMVIALQNLAMYALLFQLPILFTRSVSAEPDEIGRILLAMMAGLVLFSLVGGRLAERFGTRWTALAGALVALSGWVLLRDPGRLLEPMDALWGLLLLGCGIGISTAPAQTSAMEAAGEEASGMAAGVLSMARYFGGIVGMAALGWLIAEGKTQAGTEPHTAPLHIYGVALTAAAFAAWALPRRKASST